MKTDWHLIFAVMLMDSLSPHPFDVIQEFDLSGVGQRLDLAVIVREEQAQGETACPDQPVGLDDLAPHNLFTFKSLRESLNYGSMLELIWYYVSYAKHLNSEDWRQYLETPQPSIRVIAVTMRLPHWLRPDQNENQRRITAGVYEVDTQLGLVLRVIVTRETEQIPRNALWQLLSANPEQVQYGVECYERQSMAFCDVVEILRRYYQMEGVEVPYTLEDYERKARQRLIARLTTEDLEEIIKTIPKELFISAFSKEERLAGLSKEERLAGLSKEERRELAQQLTAEDADSSD